MAQASDNLSRRAQENLQLIMPKIKGVVAERTNHDAEVIDLSTAENWLLRAEVLPICQRALKDHFQIDRFSYPRGFAGDPTLLDALACFVNRYFHPTIPVTADHIATAPGASSCLDALLFNICDPGDGVLVPGPYWFFFDLFFQARSSVIPIIAELPDLPSVFTDSIVLALEKAFNNATTTIRALLLTNPHNPLGQNFPKPVLRSCLEFCQKHGLHLISDEVYALTSFESLYISNSSPFVSSLALDSARLGYDLSKIHMIWSPSKDFGLSGFRLGCIISQANPDLITGLALASTRQISSLTILVIEKLLQSEELDSLIRTNKQRLRKNYGILRAFLVSKQIRYMPCYAGLYVFAQVAPTPGALSSEGALIKWTREAGVLVCDGSTYHTPSTEPGWVRIVFSVDTAMLEEAILRLGTAWQ